MKNILCKSVIILLSCGAVGMAHPKIYHGFDGVGYNAPTVIYSVNEKENGTKERHKIRLSEYSDIIRIREYKEKNKNQKHRKDF